MIQYIKYTFSLFSLESTIKPFYRPKKILSSVKWPPLYKYVAIETEVMFLKGTNSGKHE